jgi:hypothetical protein
VDFLSFQTVLMSWPFCGALSICSPRIHARARTANSTTPVAVFRLSSLLVGLELVHALKMCRPEVFLPSPTKTCVFTVALKNVWAAAVTRASVAGGAAAYESAFISQIDRRCPNPVQTCAAASRVSHDFLSFARVSPEVVPATHLLFLTSNPHFKPAPTEQNTSDHIEVLRHASVPQVAQSSMNVHGSTSSQSLRPFTPPLLPTGHALPAGGATVAFGGAGFAAGGGGGVALTAGGGGVAFTGGGGGGVTLTGGGGGGATLTGGGGGGATLNGLAGALTGAALTVPALGLIKEPRENLGARASMGAASEARSVQSTSRIERKQARMTKK